MAQNIQNFQNQMQRQMQQSLSQQSQSPKDIKLEKPRCSTDIGVQNVPNVKREPPEIPPREEGNNSAMDSHENGQLPQPPIQPPANVQQPSVPTSFELDLAHGFHFPSPAVMAAMNQQIALMNQALPPFLQHGGMYAGGPGLMFAPGLPPTNFLPPARDENPLASLAANLNLNKRSLSPPDANSPEAKKQRLHHSMRMLKDEPVPEGYVRLASLKVDLKDFHVKKQSNILIAIIVVADSGLMKTAGILIAVIESIRLTSTVCVKTVVIHSATKLASCSTPRDTNDWTP